METLLYLKSAAIGLGTGVVGAAIGFFPILLLHYKLWDVVKNTAMPKNLVYNASCDLPKEVEGASEHEESDFEFKAFGSDGMNGFW